MHLLVDALNRHLRDLPRQHGPALRERFDARQDRRELVAHRCAVEAHASLIVVAENDGRQLFDLQSLGFVGTVGLSRYLTRGDVIE